MEEFLDDFAKRCGRANHQAQNRYNCDENVLKHHKAFREARGCLPEDTRLDQGGEGKT